MASNEHSKKGESDYTEDEATNQGYNSDDEPGILEYCMECLSDLSPGDPDLADYLRIIFSLLVRRYKRTGEIQDLNSALKYGTAGAEATLAGHPNLSYFQGELSTYHTDRYNMTGDLQDVEAVLNYELKIVAGTPEDHPDLPGQHNNLAMSYHDRYNHTGNLADLEAALTYGHKVLTRTPEDHPNLPLRQSNLAVFYSKKYIRTGDLSDLEAALQSSHKAMAATPEGHPDLPLRQSNLGVFYTDKYDRIGDLSDLNTALNYGHKAVAATPDGHPNLPQLQTNLASSYSSRYNRTGNLEDQEAALNYKVKAVAATPKGNPKLPLQKSNLAVSYADRYNRTGNLEDLEAALKYSHEAIAATPEGHPDLPLQQSNLAISYVDRYDRTGNLEDLEAALRYSHKALAATPKGHPESSQQQSNLAVFYAAKYIRTRDPLDLEAALNYGHEAIATTPEGHLDLPLRQNNLATSYSDRYDRTQDLIDLKSALRYSHEAVAATPEGHPSLPMRVNNLAMSYSAWYTRSRDLTHLETALKYNCKAVATTTEGHPALARRQRDLAESYLQKYGTNLSVKDFNMVHSLYTSALHSPTATPSDIWSIARTFAQHTKIFDLQHILQAYISALNCLPSLLWLGNPITVRHDTLLRNEVSLFISNAVKTALQLSEIHTAVEFFEQGLSTTHRQSLHLKFEHVNLQTELPTQSERLKHISALLQGSINKPDPHLNYHLLANERQQLISEICKHPGFEDFLLPPKYLKLCSAAQDGPVIMLNHTHIHTDIIIILSPSLPPSHLPLPNVSALMLKEQLELLRSALGKLWIHARNKQYAEFPVSQSDYSSAQHSLDAVNKWLWKFVVKPIFEFLIQNGICDGRLWWCPSGFFTYLPLHAAAPAKSSFIQSYTPTLDTLIHANSVKTSQSADSILTAVGVPKTLMSPGTWHDIHSVKEELSIVTSLFGDQSHQLLGPQASITSVIEAIQNSSWLHLACHGEQDPEDPLTSGLILYEEKLSLKQILDIDLPKAKFVYLSACETAMGDGKLTNEAMHLAGGFLAAGFQGAIGTLWSMDDKDGPNVAEIVYQTILREKNMPDVKMAAEGLHLAVQKLRKARVPPYRWMPFIHLGI